MVKRIETITKRVVNKNENIFYFRSDAIELTPRDHKYSFQHLLLKELPSSFEFDCGYVRYEAGAVIRFKDREDERFEVLFNVIKTGLPNNNPTLRVITPNPNQSK